MMEKPIPPVPSQETAALKEKLGFIDVYSEKGKGTTFKFYLPASAKEAVIELQKSTTLLAGTETILLIDDERMILEVGAVFLSKLGYTVITAVGGKQAIDLYEKKKDQIACVMLDMIMPDINGSETFDRLKAIDPTVKVLLSSGYSINGQALDILNRGCSGFIQKPFSLQTLSHKIREILDCRN